MDFTALRNLRPAEFETAADGYRAAGDMANSAREALERRIIAHMRTELKGEALEAATKQLSELAQNFHYVQVECGLVSTTLNALASDLAGPKKRLEAAVADAEAEKFTVNPDGSVSYPAAGEKVDGKLPDGGTATGIAKPSATGSAIDLSRSGYDQSKASQDAAANFDPNPNYRKAAAYANRIAQAVHDATEADLLWAPKLRQLKADDELTVSAADWIDAKKDTGGVRAAAKDYLADVKLPAAGADPESNAQWWKGLSQREKDAVVALHPASVGSLDGLPAAVRDDANRTVLAETHAEASQNLRDYDRKNAEPVKYEQKWSNSTQVPIQGEKQLTVAWKKWDAQRADIAGRLAKIEALQGFLAGKDSGGRLAEGLPERYLLGFDADANHGDGRVIVANGNPDAADHVAVYVPGSKTLMSNIGDEMEKSEKLWLESQKYAPGETVATITWFDYDAPRTAAPFEGGDILPEVSSDSRAADGAPRLRQFLDGSLAAHQAATGDKAHTTLIGHSYGTTLMGDAAKYRPDYHDSWSDPLPVDDVVTVASPGVQAKRPGDLGLDPEHFWAMASPDDSVPLGGRLVGLGDESIVPTDREFGANIMVTDTAGHGGYWDDTESDEASESLKNQARVIAGRYDDVSLNAEAHG